jgi:hypothetical protein
MGELEYSFDLLSIPECQAAYIANGSAQVQDIAYVTREPAALVGLFSIAAP